MIHLLLAIIYLSFISLGLPDSLLGSAWPTMHAEMNIPVSYAGVISMIISVGTIFSSLQSDRLTRKLGTGKVTAISVAMTAAALLGFSFSRSFRMLCLWAIPYGLGAGSVDASLNNYVALHYASRHMSWLHCMWGVGASASPYLMSYAITGGKGWHMGYRYVALIQMVLTAILLLSLPLWRTAVSGGIGTGNADSAVSSVSDGAGTETAASREAAGNRPLSLKQIFAIPGATQIVITFFCYCALESTAGLWATSYLISHNLLSAETVAGFAAMFFLGITAGRAVSGFLTIKFSDTAMIRLGLTLIFLGIIVILLPADTSVTLTGLILIGLGCAPVYPCIIHSTPEHFGAENSQALIGVQMACAYTGSCLMPPLFGLIANHITVSLFPWYLMIFLVLMAVMHEKMIKKTK